MTTRRAIPTWRGTTHRVAVPRTRAPFVNTPLIALRGNDGGGERFWISTYAADTGCLGAVVDEWGGHRIVRLDPAQHGCYSAVQTDDDTLWLCGHLDRLVRLDLRRLDSRVYATGAPPALVFQGMAFDRCTGKLFALGSVSGDTVAFSFDTQLGRPAGLHRNFTPLHYMRFSFPNGDGTHTIIAQTPDVGLLRWDPVAETVETSLEALDIPKEFALRLVSDDRGRWYFPTRGWYDPQSGTLDASGPAPQREMTWFARCDGAIYGAASGPDALTVGRWDLATGKVTDVVTAPDARPHSIALTRSSKLIAVNTYGVFSRWDAADGALEASVVLPANVVNHTDCVCRLDDRRLLGTPFISQRFWVADLHTGRGVDMGRAAGGGGEILAVWRVGRKAYMAAYTGGDLMEFDPALPARYPENPRVVASPPRSLRPTAKTQDGRRLYYGCTAPYGSLGCTLTAYDTRVGRAAYAVDPVPGHAVYSLYCDRRRGVLFAGTTPHSDCQSCPPEHDHSVLAAFDIETLATQAVAAAPGGAQVARVLGPIDRRHLLCVCLPRYGLMTDLGAGWFLLDADSVSLPTGDKTESLPAELRRIEYAGRPGTFVLLIGRRVELWDFPSQRPLCTLARRFNGYNIIVQDRSVYLLAARSITVLDNCLPPDKR